MRVELHGRFFWQEDVERLGPVLAATSLTTGDPVRDFEHAFAERFGAAACVAVTSGTAALEAALVGAGVGPGVEVITSALTGVATLHAIMRAGGTPRVVDVDAETGLMDLDLVEAALSRRTKVLVPVHLHGQMVDMKRVRAIADQHGLKVVEDAAAAIEASRDGVRPGQLSDAACFNFFSSFTLTCGKGGAIVTSDTAMADRLRRRRQHGMAPRPKKDVMRKGAPPYDVLEVGPEEDLDDLRATLLNARLPRLDAAWELRSRVAARYDEAFRDLGHIYAPSPAEGVVHARQAYPIRAKKRAGVRAYLKERGVATALHWPVVTRLSFYGEYFADLELPRATALGDESLLLPVHSALTDKEQRHVIDAVLGPRSRR